VLRSRVAASAVRVVVLGRGGAGKSTFARELGRRTGVPVVELDAHFWSASLEPLPREQWATRQADLVAGQSWIVDGDLGPYDVLDVRLRRADTVVLLDLSFARCAWQAVRRSGRPPTSGPGSGTTAVGTARASWPPSPRTPLARRCTGRRRRGRCARSWPG
jgi:hypothetical protein